MTTVQSGQARSFALIGHSGDGKTSIGESMLHVAGATRERGSVDDGSSVLNSLPDENDGRHTHSITSHLFAFDWHGNHYTLIDTPGDPNFAGDGELALEAVDGAILVLDGQAGVKSGTSRMMHLAEAKHVPLLAFVNGLDRGEVDLDQTLAALAKLDVTPVPLSIPALRDGHLDGVIDLLDMSWHASGPEAAEAAGPVPEDFSDVARRFHELCVEAVAEHDDALLEKYLEEGDLSREDIVRGLAEGIRSHRILPVLCGSATEELGVDIMLRELEELLPTPEQHEAWQATRVDDEAEEIAIEGVEEAPFSAVVFKTILDRYVGMLSVMRVVSGRLTPDSTVLNATRGTRSRVGKLLLLHGEEQEEVAEARPGDVVAVPKLKDVHTGDVLTCEKGGVHLREPRLPEGVLRYAIEPAKRSEEDKVFTSLAKLVEEDPALHLDRDPQTGEFLLSGMGELHIRTTIARLERLFGVSVVLHRPKVPYRETVRGRVQGVEGKLKKQSGGAGMYGVCYVDLEPLPRGSGVVFEDRVVGGAIPRGLIPAVEKGVREACEAGPLAGFPVVDVKVSVVDGKYHSVDSNEMAFKLAGSFALKAAVQAAKPCLLEPHVEAEVSVPSALVGEVLKDLASRRGTVHGTEATGDDAKITATVPMSEMLEYANVLTSLTGGKGEFSMHFSHYDELGGKLAEGVIEAARKAREGES